MRVVGLPLHLWTSSIFNSLGGACEGFVEVDRDLKLRVHLRWARILVRLGEFRPSEIHVLEGSRSFVVQIWWEMPPAVMGVFPGVSSNSSIHEVEGDAISIARGRVETKVAEKVRSDLKGQSFVAESELMRS